jgi:uncharacterized protein (DUF433 family)
MALVITERITKTPGILSGKACVAGHRIRVMDIVIWHEDLSMGPDEIVAVHHQLTLSDVHAALAYYSDNVAEIRTTFGATRMSPTNCGHSFLPN